MMTKKQVGNDSDVLLVGETVCKQIVDPAAAFRAVESVFAAMANDQARNFPVVREPIGHADAIYGFKSGFDKAGLTLGVKSGGYWPHNAEAGLTNHQSTIFLFDPDTGRLQALVGGNYLTAVRTAASSAVSIAHLARSDARTIGIVGAGHQSTFQLRAAVAQRNFTRVVAWNKTPEHLSNLASVADELGLEFVASSREALGEEADVIITITSAFEPLLAAGVIRPGTHIACMGTDTRGKQELDPQIFVGATVFTDEIAQSISIGEAQHAVGSGLITEEDITPIGKVISGAHAGRSGADEITVFDGTGVGLQDLAVASVAVELAKAQGLAIRFALE
jgi:ornithine cyclodeaminase